MMKSRIAQQGFTLIELVMVIVILGILAAIALPKFIDLQKDARVATVNGARGSLASTAAMAHAKYLATVPAPASVTAEGAVITFETTNNSGYPQADAGLTSAAGLSATDYSSSVTGTTLKVSPISASAASITAGTCSVTYTEPTSATSGPTIAMVTTGC